MFCNRDCSSCFFKMALWNWRITLYPIIKCWWKLSPVLIGTARAKVPMDPVSFAPGVHLLFILGDIITSIM